MGLRIRAQEATAAQVSAGTAGPGFYISPRRLSGLSFNNPTFTGTITASGATLDLGTTGVIQFSSDTQLSRGAADTLLVNTTSGSTAILELAAMGTVEFKVSTNSSTIFLDASNTGGSLVLRSNINVSALTLSASQAIRFNGSTYQSAGALSTDSSGNVTTVSDRRMKDIGDSFDRGLEAIVKLRPKFFRWNKKSGLNQHDLNAGFIAQEVERVIPEAVFKNKEGFRSLMDRAILAALVNSVRELDRRTRKVA